MTSRRTLYNQSLPTNERPIEAYDVLQVLYKGEWLDYSTLRTQQEFDDARAIVTSKRRFAPDQDGFRVVDMCHRFVVLAEAC